MGVLPSFLSNMTSGLGANYQAGFRPRRLISLLALCLDLLASTLSNCASLSSIVSLHPGSCWFSILISSSVNAPLPLITLPLWRAFKSARCVSRHLLNRLSSTSLEPPRPLVPTLPSSPVSQPRVSQPWLRQLWYRRSNQADVCWASWFVLK